MSSPFKIIASKEDQDDLLDNFDTFLFDCDGVLWEGAAPIDGSIESLKHLLSLNKQLIFVTNNSSKSRKQYASKFVQLGFPAVDPKDIVTSGSSAAFHSVKLMAKNHATDGKNVVFYIGLEALGEELGDVGLEHIWASQIELPRSLAEWNNYAKNPKVGLVIVGADWEFNYHKATAAATYLARPEVDFIGTNRDPNLPTSNPEIKRCGTGSIIKMVETGAEREAFYVGKPEPAMWDHIEDELKEKMDLSRTLMVGDTLYTDIEFANSRGIASLLVETGNHTREHVVNSLSKPLQVPTYVAKSLKDAIVA